VISNTKRFSGKANKDKTQKAWEQLAYISRELLKSKVLLGLKGKQLLILWDIIHTSKSKETLFQDLTCILPYPKDKNQ